jgi:hypothetical protein
MQIPAEVENWTTAEWIAEVKKKTTANFIMGLFLGFACAVGLVALAFVLY